MHVLYGMQVANDMDITDTTDISDDQAPAMDASSASSLRTEVRASGVEGSSAPAGAARPQFRWGLFVQHLCTVVIVVLLLGVVVGFAVGYRPLHRQARNTIAASPAKVEVIWPALKTAPGETPRTWLPEQFQQQIMDLALAQLGESPAVFSSDPLESVGIAMEESGWFSGRPRVMRVGENTIRIEGEWRSPAAVVRIGSKDLLISWDGRMMPPTYDLNASGLCVILPVSTPHPIRNDGRPDFSGIWSGADIEAALELLATLMPQPWSTQVAGIDITDYAQTQQLAIITRNETRIIWGGKPSKPLLGETSTRSKLDRIAEINRRFSSIDAKRAAIDISGVHAVEINIAASAQAAVQEDGEKLSVRQVRTGE